MTYTPPKAPPIPEVPESYDNQAVNEEARELAENDPTASAVCGYQAFLPDGPSAYGFAPDKGLFLPSDPKAEIKRGVSPAAQPNPLFVDEEPEEPSQPKPRAERKGPRSRSGL